MPSLARFRSLMRTRDANKLAILRLDLISWLGIVCFPLYYLIFTRLAPQPFESATVRGIGFALCLGGLLARRLPPVQRDRYTLLLLGYGLPFFATFMFLMNDANSTWSQCLLVSLLALFHFDTRSALIAYGLGTLAAVALAVAQGKSNIVFSQSALQLLPVQWFMIVWSTVAKSGRNSLEQEKLSGLGEGLGTVAHEMRTPLASMDANIRGLLRLQRGPDTPPETRQALARMQYEVRHMNHIIDLFLLSAMAVRKRQAPDESVSMLDTVDAVLRRYPFTGDAQRQLVALQVRRDFRFAGQSELAVIIVLNLLRNALQAIHRAGKGRVRIVIDGGRRVPRLLVIDTGCGIPRHHMPRIFERFYAFPAHAGAGIGLALSLQIMQAWKACLRCVSRETAYTIFVLEFPLPAPNHDKLR